MYYHVAIKFDVDVKLVDSFCATVRGRLQKVAPDVAVQIEPSERVREVEGGEARWVTITFTVQAPEGNPRKAEKRGVYWLRRALPDLKGSPPHIHVKELTFP